MYFELPGLFLKKGNYIRSDLNYFMSLQCVITNCSKQYPITIIGILHQAFLKQSCTCNFAECYDFATWSPIPFFVLSFSPQSTFHYLENQKMAVVFLSFFYTLDTYLQLDSAFSQSFKGYNQSQIGRFYNYSNLCLFFSSSMTQIQVETQAHTQSMSDRVPFSKCAKRDRQMSNLAEKGALNHVQIGSGRLFP